MYPPEASRCLGQALSDDPEIAAQLRSVQVRAALRARPPAHRRRFGAIQGDESNLSLRTLARVHGGSARGWVAAETWPMAGVARIRRVRPFAAQEVAECSPLVRICIVYDEKACRIQPERRYRAQRTV